MLEIGPNLAEVIDKIAFTITMLGFFFAVAWGLTR